MWLRKCWHRISHMKNEKKNPNKLTMFYYSPLRLWELNSRLWKKWAEKGNISNQWNCTNRMAYGVLDSEMCILKSKETETKRINKQTKRRKIGMKKPKTNRILVTQRGELWEATIPPRYKREREREGEIRRWKACGMEWTKTTFGMCFAHFFVLFYKWATMCLFHERQTMALSLYLSQTLHTWVLVSVGYPIGIHISMHACLHWSCFFLVFVFLLRFSHFLLFSYLLIFLCFAMSWSMC